MVENYEKLYEEVSNQEMRKEWCEYCGSTPGYYESHHVKSKGSGGSEVRANKINLCVKCHDRAQKYEIKQEDLIVKIAQRENVPVKEVYKAIGMPVPYNIEDLEEKAIESGIQNMDATNTIEYLISMLISAEEQTNEIKFIQGELISQITARGAKYSWVASQIGKSAAWVRTMHKTFLAFPTEESRIPTLTWTHHKIAAATGEPEKWIELAADKEMSTRELRAEIIKDENKDADPGESIEEIMQKKAEKTFRGFIEVFEVGGPSADWLLSQIMGTIEAITKRESA